jgi:hypothetical protein
MLWTQDTEVVGDGFYKIRSLKYPTLLLWTQDYRIPQVCREPVPHGKERFIDGNPFAVSCRWQRAHGTV